MKKEKPTKELLKINIIVTLLIIAANFIIFFGFNTGKDMFTYISIYTNIFLFFIYLYLFNSAVNKDVLKLKKEALYINYPASITTFFVFLFLILIASAICLVTVNKEAANITFIFTFFMSTLSMLFPSIILTVFMYFLVPALILPGININKRGKKKSNTLLSLLFIAFIILCIYNIVNAAIMINNFESQNRYKSAKLTINYSTDFLKLGDISNYGKKLMSRDKINVPFFYTADSFPYSDYESADRFCRSMDARVPNYLEIYHIIFNRFDTFGEQYYWTSDKDGRYPVVLHFKNMSYEAIRKPNNTKPLLYCIAESNDNYGFKHKAFFYRNVQKENKETLDALIKKPFDFDAIKNITGMEKEKETYNETPEQEVTAVKEKKHVNFSVKEVPPEIFRELLQKGYSYNSAITIKRDYETDEYTFSSIVRKNTDNIRLCYYPFTDYGNLSLNQEREIWQQSFCSPAFDLISKSPALKTRHNKDSYCYAYGGRLPNIPELAGILKTLGTGGQNIKFWTNNKITALGSNQSMPVLVYYKDERFLNIKALTSGEDDSAYVYCIKKAENPSRVIANYKSRFANVEGLIYAKEKCPTCIYYEVPDTILQQ